MSTQWTSTIASRSIPQELGDPGQDAVVHRALPDQRRGGERQPARVEPDGYESGTALLDDQAPAFGGAARLQPGVAVPKVGCPANGSSVEA